MTLLAVDAFAGAGGLSLGLELAGWSVLLSFDNDQVAVDTMRKNLGHRAEVLDALEVNGATIAELAALGDRRLDLLAGGPPCQGFSLQRRGERHDSRSLLVLRYLEWLEELIPRSFLIENVPAIRSVRGRHLIEQVETKAREMGYDLYSTVLDAVDFGVAQRRRRAFLVGLPAGAPFRWPEPLGHQLTVRSAIGDLESPPADGTHHSTIPNHYREARLSAINRERIRHVPPGGGREHLPPHLQLECHANGHRHLDTYGRLAWDEPAVTITARFDSFTRGRFGHPVEDRTITLREGARLQSFPDSFVFLGSRADGARLIGNAVPPLLGAALGRSLAAALQ